MRLYEQLRIDEPLPLRDTSGLWPSLVLAAIVAVSMYVSELTPARILSGAGWKAAADFLSGLFPPEVSVEFLKLAGRAAAETLAISIAGITFAILFGGLVSPFGSRVAVRGMLSLIRSIPDVIWAVFFVRIVGLGPFAGVLAIGISYGAILGKIYSELMDSAPQPAIDALTGLGAGRLGQLIFAIVPQAWSDLTGYSLYRWECAVRSAALLGIVGAGGLGQEIELSMRLFKYSEVTTMVAMLIVMVLAIDWISTRIREAS